MTNDEKINISRVAFVACGGLRNFSESYKTWNVFDSQDNYVFTWNYEYEKSCEPPTEQTYKISLYYEQYKAKYLTNTYDLSEAKKNGYIVDYRIYEEIPTMDYKAKNPFLWSCLETYLSYDYDYVLITRPDMWLQKRNPSFVNQKYSLPKENEVQTMTVKHDDKFLSDHIFFMTRSTFEKFSKIYNYKNFHMIHHCIYQYLQNQGLQVTDMLQNYLDLHFNRTASKINFESELQIMEEEARTIAMFFAKPPDIIPIVPVLIISDDKLSAKDKQNYFNLGIQKFNNEYTPSSDYRPNFRCFESSDVQLGLNKIKHFCKLYDVKILHIQIIEASKI